MKAITQREEHSLTVNSEQRTVCMKPTDTLLYTLRQDLGLTGAKPGCENGDCGACTVLVDERPIKSCMMLTAEALDKDILTVEGLKNSPVQKAFLDSAAFQCGYCTSGFLMTVTGLLKAHPKADEARMTEWLRSNICRCTCYQEIGNAVSSLLPQGERQQKERETEAAPAVVAR